MLVSGWGNKYNPKPNSRGKAKNTHVIEEFLQNLGSVVTPATLRKGDRWMLCNMHRSICSPVFSPLKLKIWHDHDLPVRFTSSAPKMLPPRPRCKIRWRASRSCSNNHDAPARGVTFSLERIKVKHAKNQKKLKLWMQEIDLKEDISTTLSSIMTDRLRAVFFCLKILWWFMLW